jgi:hypothetical protein
MAASRTIKVLVATQAREIYEILGERDNVAYDIALYTGTIRASLPDVQLVIIDYEDLVEYPLSEVEIREELHQSQVVQCSSSEFAANPDRFLGELVANRPGAMLSLPGHYCLAFVSYSGGTGRTTLALDTALRYAEVLGKHRGRRASDEDLEAASIAEADQRSALVLELTFGSSSVVAVTGIDMPHLYQLTTDTETHPQVYKGVDLVPMDYENVRVLSSDYVKRYFAHQIETHELSIVDAAWPHGLADAIVDKVDLWIVVATERADTVANAQKLSEELRARYGENKVWLLQNVLTRAKKRGNNGDQTTQTLAWNIQVPTVNSPDSYRGEMGEIVLSQVFAPIWSDYTKSRRSSLFS